MAVRVSESLMLSVFFKAFKVDGLGFKVQGLGFRGWNFPRALEMFPTLS